MDRLKTMLIGLAIFGGVKYCNAADTRAERDEQHVAVSAAGSGDVLRPGRRIGVVVDERRQAELRLQRGPQRH